MAEHATDLSERCAPWSLRMQMKMHLLLCQNCRRYFDQLRLTRQLLRQTRCAEPPLDVARVLESIERTQRRGPG